MLSWEKEAKIAAYNTIITLLKQRRFTPKLVTLDNETSNVLLQSFESAAITIYLVAPHVHRGNVVERAIRIFKTHFIAILCGTDSKFPLNLWSKFLPQVKIT